MSLSNNQADQLGKRLRQGSKEKEDFEALERFRNSFRETGACIYSTVEKCLEKEDAITITERNTKTRQSIIDKLQRERTLRLSHIQDIEGCRIVVKGTCNKQKEIENVLTDELNKICNDVMPKTRCNETGYRAIHIIVKKDKKHYEIQLRTLAQDIWANMAEGLAKEDNKLKYGKGDKHVQDVMKKLSDKLAEEIDRKIFATSDEHKEKIEKIINACIS